MEPTIISIRLARIAYHLKTFLHIVSLFTVMSFVASILLCFRNDLQTTLYSAYVSTCFLTGALFWIYRAAMVASQMSDRAKEQPADFEKLLLSIKIFYAGADLLVVCSFVSFFITLTILAAEISHLDWQWIFMPTAISASSLVVFALALWN